MPTYEYRCDEGHAFERIQKMSDKPLTKCPECGAKASRQISGGSGLIFKGSGFYITDYGKDGKGARKDPPAEGAAAKSEKSEKSESAPAKEAAAPKVEAPKPAAKTTPSST
jgi:putative FmdB family regulatory protein